MNFDSYFFNDQEKLEVQSDPRVVSFVYKKMVFIKKRLGLEPKIKNWVRNIIPEAQIRPDPFFGNIKSATSVINYNSNYTKYIELNCENTHLSTLN